MTPTSSESPLKEDTEIPRSLTSSSRWISIGEKVNLYSISVRFDLDSLKKEWNDNQNVIKNKKKVNKEDKCEDELKIKAEN